MDLTAKKGTPVGKVSLPERTELRPQRSLVSSETNSMLFSAQTCSKVLEVANTGTTNGLKSNTEKALDANRPEVHSQPCH